MYIFKYKQNINYYTKRKLKIIENVQLTFSADEWQGLNALERWMAYQFIYYFLNFAKVYAITVR